MPLIRYLSAVAVLIALFFGWRLAYVPTWAAVLAGIALLVWGLNLDWRRKERAAEEKAQEKERQSR